jgi:hypothetical protein
MRLSSALSESRQSIISCKEEASMRFGRVALACAAATSSLALLATGASAFQHPSLNGRCRIGIEVVPRRITAGEPVTIFGRLRCRRQVGAANRVVRLFHHVPGAPGFTFVQSTTTDAQGFYQFQRADGVVETNRVWHVDSRGAESANRRIRVAARVTLSGPPEGTQILTGPANKVTFTGTVSPADVGAHVILQRQNSLTGDEWHRIDSGRVQAGGAFSITHTFIVPGDANIRVLVRSQGRNIPSPSTDVLAYEISQAQDPALTINASADPIVYGQSVTISGTLAGGANQPVTLLARVRGQHGFAPVAQATTDAAGNYAFPAQAPVNSTFYRVEATANACPPPPPGAAACDLLRRASTVKSAVLYEAVKYVLTAQVSATSVQEGQTLTFSGSVAPSDPGHVIYLERQNIDHEFQVVQVGTLTAGSTYSIAHQVYSTGTQVFRVHIPGGPRNAGAFSQPFTIQVTSAPAGMLMPEAPGNSTAPSEGSTSPAEGEKEEKEGATGEGETPPGRQHQRR